MRLHAIWVDGLDKIQVVPLLIITPLAFMGGSFYSINMPPPIWQKYHYRYIVLSALVSPHHATNIKTFFFLGSGARRSLDGAMNTAAAQPIDLDLQVEGFDRLFPPPPPPPGPPPPPPSPPLEPPPLECAASIMLSSLSPSESQQPESSQDAAHRQDEVEKAKFVEDFDFHMGTLDNMTSIGEATETGWNAMVRNSQQVANVLPINLGSRSTFVKELPTDANRTPHFDSACETTTTLPSGQYVNASFPLDGGDGSVFVTTRVDGKEMQSDIVQCNR
jgi:hypothetical protein